MIGAYVTGTDTGIGKTRVSVALLRALRAGGVDACGMKPVASGCEDDGAGPRNDDALALQAAGPPGLDYALINPCALRAATAPEIAARRDGVAVELDGLVDSATRLQARHRLLLVEGVGGWLAPLAPALMQADLVRRLQLPVLLVVGLRLGCINHALLTARALAADGVATLGWVANRVDPDLDFADETLQILRQRLPLQWLGTHAHGDTDASSDPGLQPAVARLAALGQPDPQADPG